MRRLIPRLVLCLALGLATAVAVALAIAALTPVPKYPRHTTGAFVRWDRAWGANEAHHFGLVHIWWADTLGTTSPTATLFDSATTPEAVVQIQRERARENQALGRTKYPLKIRNSPRSWGTFAAAAPPPEPFVMGSDAGFGFPAPCLWYQVLTTFNPATMSTVTDELRGGFLLFGTPDSRGERYRALPLRPIWFAGGGLALNTAFYALLWFALLVTPPAVRRCIRRRRGHCPACGYDVQHAYTRPCPECGATPDVATP